LQFYQQFGKITNNALSTKNILSIFDLVKKVLKKMRLSKIAFLLGLLIVSTTALAQYDDDETVQARKSTHKKEKVSAPNAAKVSKKDMKQKDSFKSSVNKTTHLSKKEQAKLQAKKQKERSDRYSENRERMQDKQTVKRMKKNEKYSYRTNSQKGKSWSKRNAKAQNSKARKASRKKAKALEKRQDEAREKYENNDYKPGARKTTKSGKIREFYNPFKRDKK